MPDDRRRDDSRPADPAEGVRIIGADEAAEAIERGDVAARRGGDLPRYGDRPARPPVGPKPALRFPLEAGADPADAAVRPAKGTRFDPRPPPAWDDPAPAAEDEEGDPWPADSTWGDAEATWDDSPHDDVVAWSQGDTAAQPVVDAGDEEPAGDAGDAADDTGLAWADDFVDEDDPWDGSWDEPTGAVHWADDRTDPVEAAAGGGEAGVEGGPGPVDPVPDAPGADPGPEAVDDAADDAADDWAAFAEGDAEPEPPRRSRGLFSRRRLAEDGPAEEPAEPAVAATTEPDETDGSALADPAEAPAPAPVLFDDAADAAVDDDTVVADAPAPEPAEGPGDESTEVAAEAAEPAGAPAPEADDEADGAWPADDADDDLSWGAPDEEASDRGVFDESGGWAEPAGSTVFDFADEPSGQVELPHWTEPATGELPQVLAGDEPAPAAPPPAAHWRSHDAGWDVDDFDDLSDDEDVRVGALDLDRPSEEDIYSFEELDEVGRGQEPAEPVAPDGPARRVPPARPHPGVTPAGGGGAGRNIGVATVVGVGAAVLAVALLAMGAKFAMVLVVVILGAAVGEYQNATRRAGYRPAALLGIVAAACYPLAVYWKGVEAYPLLLVLTVATALAWHLVGADGDARVVESAGVTFLGVAWIGGLGSFAALLLSLPDGRGMLVAAILAAVGYDVGGLLIGRTMGTRALSDASPNKTVEGLVGGMLISLFVVFVVCGLFGLAPFDSPGAALKIGFVAALVAPLGDLCESLVKRDLGIKDMSSLLPEHGGVLDRFDGLLFVLPAVFYGAMLFELGPF